jgi:HSP20 family protein
MRNSLVRRPTSLLDEFFNDEFFLPTLSRSNALDVYQENDNYIVEVDLPGFTKEDISIAYNNDLLTIRAQHAEETSDDSKKYVYRSRSRSLFTRQIRFSNINSDAIEAKYDNGVLKVTLPCKQNTVNTKQIEVK